MYAGYCSSDAWVGNAGADSNSFGWAFRGQHHVEALIATITEPCPVIYETRIHFANHTHLDVNTTYVAEPLGAGSRLLFSGCSAGARGAMFNIDYVAAMLPPGVELRGFFDSPLWVDVLPLESNITSLENETQTILPLINATARLSAACVAVYPGEQAWRCLFGQYRVPFVQTPYLMSASQFDRYQLPWNEGTMPPYVGPALTYANAFQKAVRSVVLDLPTAAQVGSAIYSSACFRHCVTMIGAYWGVKVEGMSLNDYVAMWYFGSTDPEAHVNPQDGGQSGTALPPGLSDQHIESCNGFGCGECHAKTARPAPPLPPAYATSLIPGVGVAGGATSRAARISGAPLLPRVHSAIAARRSISMRDTAIAVGGGLGVAAVLLLCACLVARRAKQAQMQRVAATGPTSAQAQRARESSPLLPRTGSAARPAAAAKSPSRSASSSSAASAAGGAKRAASRVTPQPPPPPRGAMRTAKPANFGL